MPTPLAPWMLANAVTGFATAFAGLMALALSALTGGQPRRWLWAYAGIFITGVPTVLHHGLGEPGLWPAYWTGLADIGTNLLLGWLLVMAALGDFYSVRSRWIIGGATGLADLAFIVARLAAGPGSPSEEVLRFGDFGGFKVGELLLIANSLLAVGLLYARLGRIPARARPLWYFTTALFILGTLLATASNDQVDAVFIAWHALWHLVGACGFMALWAFNHVRFRKVV
ncbi:MAG: hypothetical protein N2204_05590 [Anaerolineae bacterium]|nr:hypothetical protein [Anaerolineae bacterium]